MPEAMLACTHCGAPVDVRAKQRFHRCAYCGAKYFLARGQGHAIELEAFEDILNQRLESSAIDAIQLRLASIEGEIGRQEKELVRKQHQLNTAQAILREARSQYGKAVSFGQNWTYVAGLIGVVAWFSSLFILPRAERYVGLATALLITFVARGFHLDWSDASLGMQRRLDDARRMAEQTEKDLAELEQTRQDLQLERELGQRVSVRHADVPAPQSVLLQSTE